MRNLLLIITISLAVSAQAQHERNEVTELMYRAYLERSQSLWEKALIAQQKESMSQLSNFNSQLKLAETYFALLHGTLAIPSEEFFDTHVSDAKKLVKKLIDENDKSGEVVAILSSIYGNEIGHSPMKGMLLGSKSSSLAAKGKIMAPNSALAWRVYGNNKYYTPETFGGDMKEALEAFEKAVVLLESKPDQLAQNWLYIDTLAILGQAYSKSGYPDKAIATYEKALRAEPNFTWVKSVLLPAVKNTIPSK